jgi:gamma-glutamylcyclotransferase (GGCT)/AIG2-like uncharacterized protein YtfP
MTGIVKAKQRLFVYGTLARGRQNSHLLEGIGGTWSRARVKGTLHAKGWGATMGYPAIVLDERGEDIEGDLFSSERLLDQWTRLDEFEGPAYQRVSTEVTLDGGSTAIARVYVLRSQPSRPSLGPESLRRHPL